MLRRVAMAMQGWALVALAGLASGQSDGAVDGPVTDRALSARQAEPFVPAKGGERPGAAGVSGMAAWFVPDGDIREFIYPSQDFMDLSGAPLTNPNYGRLLASAVLGRGVRAVQDTRPLSAQPTGFSDRPGVIPPEIPAPTGFNLGWVFVAHDPVVDGCFVALDISAPRALDTFFETAPVAFDVDGDGSTLSVTEINPGCVPEAPLNGADEYRCALDLNDDGAFDVLFELGETTDPLPFYAIPLARCSLEDDGFDGDFPPANASSGPGDPAVTRYVRLAPLNGSEIGDFLAWAVYHLDANGDGAVDDADFGVGRDVEFVLRNITTAAPGESADPFGQLGVSGVVRLWVTVDSDDDFCLGGGEDGLETELEIRKRVDGRAPALVAPRRPR